jgi:hypothetical protein
LVLNARGSSVLPLPLRLPSSRDGTVFELSWLGTCRSGALMTPAISGQSRDPDAEAELHVAEAELNGPL